MEGICKDPTADNYSLVEGFEKVWKTVLVLISTLTIGIEYLRLGLPTLQTNTIIILNPNPNLCTFDIPFPNKKRKLQ